MITGAARRFSPGPAEPGDLAAAGSAIPGHLGAHHPPAVSAGQDMRTAPHPPPRPGGGKRVSSRAGEGGRRAGGAPEAGRVQLSRPGPEMPREPQRVGSQ